MMQQQSAEKFTPAERLQKLRVLRQLTWKELAGKLGVTESFIYQVQRGDRHLSDKARYRLSVLEVEAGLELLTAEESVLEIGAIRNWLKGATKNMKLVEKTRFLSDVINTATQELQSLHEPYLTPKTPKRQK